MKMGDTMNKIIRAVATLGFTLALYGCGARNMYDLEVRNAGKEQLDDVAVKYDNFDFTFGVVSPNSRKNHGFVGKKHPVPEKATVSWKTPDGKLHAQTVNVKNKLPKSFDDITIMLDIDVTGNVSVSWEQFKTYK